MEYQLKSLNTKPFIDDCGYSDIVAADDEDKTILV